MGVAQFQLINKILNDGNYDIVVDNNLTDKYFFDFVAEFNFIKNHYNKYNTVPDKMTFKNVFRDFELREVTEPVSYLVDALTGEYKKEFLKEQFNKMKTLLESGDLDSAEKTFVKANEDLASTSLVIRSTDLFTDTSRYDRYVDRTINKDKYYLSTGLSELDEVMGGIDRKNENMVISARTGVGKTQVLCKMATSAAKAGLNVGFYEGEMTADKIGARVDTMYGHISNTAINRGDLLIQKEYKRYIESLASSGNHLHIFTQADYDGPITVDVLASFVKQKKLDILFIDQYSLLESSGHFRSEWEKIADISKKVKVLQTKVLIPIISVVQMNRTKQQDESGNEILDATQISGSDRIGQDATDILMLTVKEDVLTIHIAKARDGAKVNKLKYQIDFNLGTFNYLPMEGDNITSEETFQNIASEYAVDEEVPF